MGRNRELIRMLMKYVNLFSQYDDKIKDNNIDISISAQRWQTLECIIEYEDENKNMVFMANQLGLSKSTFSKYVKVLVDNGLVDRYQHTDNRKDIVLKSTKKGHKFYQMRSKIILEEGWKEPFAVLDKLSDENMAIIVEFMTKMVSELEPENNKVRELIKLQEMTTE